MKEKLTSAKKTASIWKQRFEDLHKQFTELKEKAQPYLDALEIASDKVRAFLSGILARGKDTHRQERQMEIMENRNNRPGRINPDKEGNSIL